MPKPATNVEWMTSSLKLSIDVHPEDFALIYTFATEEIVDALLACGVPHNEIRFTEEEYFDIDYNFHFYVIEGRGPRPVPQTKETNEPTAD